MKEKTLLERVISNPFIQTFVIYVSGGWIVLEMTDYFINNYGVNEKVRDILLIILLVGLPVAIFLAWIIYKKKQTSSFDESAIKEITTGKKDKKEQHNLPVQLTKFIGREKQIQTIRELISKHRIVSLTGGGGCGKTRLACEVAAQLVQDYKDGVWLVDLAPITAEELVAKEITEVLKIPEVPDQPIIDILCDKIKNKNLLIILDNCEHLIKTCVEITGKLVQSVPGLRILITSREALNITGEKVWKLPSLTLLDPKTIIDIESAKSSEAVLLFTDRAQMNNPEFELETTNVSEVVTICNKLDGIPLALELVASRTRHMNTQMILERFADRFDRLPSSDPRTSKRQKTLQATIEWSYNLLSDREKLLFTRLAVFSGNFDLEAAEEVCSDDQLPRKTILDLLSRLVDRSLVYIMKGTDESMRYTRLETLRQFASQKLKDGEGEKDVKTRHLYYFLNMAEDAYKEQFELQLKWLNRLEQEHDNLIAALNWSENHSPVDFIRLSGTLTWFWRNHSHLLLGKDYLEKALVKNVSKSTAFGRVLCGNGIMLMAGDVQRSIKVLNESLEIFREFRNQFEEAIATKEIGMLHNMERDYKKGTECSKQSLDLARKVGKPGLINFCLGYFLFSLLSIREFDQARPLVEEFLASSEKLKLPIDIVQAHHFGGDCALGLKEFKESEKRYGLTIETSLKIENTFQVGIDIQGVAFSVSGQSRWAKSIRLDAASRKILKEFGVTMDGMVEFWDEFIDTYIEGAKKELGEEMTRKYEEEGTAMGFEKAVEYALDFKKD